MNAWGLIRSVGTVERLNGMRNDLFFLCCFSVLFKQWRMDTEGQVPEDVELENTVHTQLGSTCNLLSAYMLQIHTFQTKHRPGYTKHVAV